MATAFCIVCGHWSLNYLEPKKKKNKTRKSWSLQLGCAGVFGCDFNDLSGHWQLGLSLYSPSAWSLRSVRGDWSSHTFLWTFVQSWVCTWSSRLPGICFSKPLFSEASHFPVFLAFWAFFWSYCLLQLVPPPQKAADSSFAFGCFWPLSHPCPP